MKLNFARLIVAAIALSFPTSSGAAQGLSPDKDLPNFRQVNQHLYRGGQLKRGSIGHLAQLGIRTIVNLRATDEHSRAEEAEAKAAGLRFYNVPMGAYGKPTDEEVERVLAVISDPANQPVFVHCQRGKDRTGTIIACYRLTHDNWTIEQALQEASQIGMGWWEFGMKKYLREFAARRNPRSVVDFNDDFSRDLTVTIV